MEWGSVIGRGVRRARAWFDVEHLLATECPHLCTRPHQGANKNGKGENFGVKSRGVLENQQQSKQDGDLYQVHRESHGHGHGWVRAKNSVQDDLSDGEEDHHDGCAECSADQAGRALED